MSIINFSGLASGIDSDSLIKAIMDSRRLVNAPLQQKVDSNKKENEALQQFNTKLLQLNDSLKDFLTLSGTAVTKVATSSDSNTIDATASSGAFASQITITTKQLAKAGTLSFADRFSSSDKPLAPNIAQPGNFEITVGTGQNAKTVSATITASTTLTDLIQTLNDQSENKFQVSAVNMSQDSSPQYTLVVSGIATGVTDGSLQVNVAQSIQDQGLFQQSTLDQAQDAVVTVAGLGDIQRPTNQITDLLPGVTLNLKQTNTNPVTITVANNAGTTADKFEKGITTLNDLINYSKANNKIERFDNNNSVSNIFGFLAKTDVDNHAIFELRSALSDSSSGSSSVNSFADLGVTINRDETYAFNRQQFIDGINKDPTAAEKILHSFADRVGSATGIIAKYTQFQGQIETAVQSNEEQNTSINTRLDAVEQNLQKQTDALRQQFTNLEKNTARLNAGASFISSLLLSSVSSRR